MNHLHTSLRRRKTGLFMATLLLCGNGGLPPSAIAEEERKPLSLPEAGERAPLPMPDIRGRERFLPSGTRQKEAARLQGVPEETGKWSGYVAVESRAFLQDALFPEQDNTQFSLALQPEFYKKWDNGKQSFTFVPFYRKDQRDEQRTHFDIREMTWLKVGKAHEWRVGIRKVFWGVTESQHLVDIINQTDLVENPDGEDKLGQPMINLALMRDWGTLDLFVLPGSRERTFPGINGRLRFPLRVDTSQAQYESGSKWRHIDLAARWALTAGNWDIGLSHFYGTSRDPQFSFGLDSTGKPVLIPYYALINQTGLDVQMAMGSLLWKLEAIYRSGFGPKNYVAATAGLEYTLSGIFGSGMDLGLLTEYLYDERGNQATTPFQDDVMAGLRLAVNDVQSTEVLMGVIFDRTTSARFLNLEASRRLGDNWKLNMEARAYSGLPPTNILYGFRNDDYLQIELARFF